MPPALTLPDGRRLALDDRPLLMGIVNITPDSFSDGGMLQNAGQAIAHGARLMEEGADIVDVGGESTRPGHAPLDAATELGRVLPVIAGLRERVTTPLSIDTWKAEVAEAAVKAGASIVNDVWGAQRDPAIAGVAARHGAPIILMHNRETTDPGLDILSDVLRFLERSIAIAREAGVPHEQIVVDPGIGLFGKTPEQSLRLIRELAKLESLGCPILLGASRKSVIGVVTGQSVPAERVAGSVAAHLYGATQGAAIIRVHDVAAHAQAFKVWRALSQSSEPSA
ncbi:dihydropteroate synthase [Bosea sp. (in: a-proteobacteria)]|uniref:dihydropteroate synthase n=1 Tax=Bosea sp. (in: a-proteobacteria) TaxID=1871050 RepID=UPI002735251A|nr:dihydropteroate synthase [Bosea sp. (in: a-proteobacteria)]MDP3257780.1 dihydropteroate synthase [Bosea sp. (in: a-proteobacteria)]